MLWQKKMYGHIQDWTRKKINSFAFLEEIDVILSFKKESSSTTALEDEALLI